MLMSKKPARNPSQNLLKCQLDRLGFSFLFLKVKASSQMACFLEKFWVGRRPGEGPKGATV